MYTFNNDVPGDNYAEKQKRKALKEIFMKNWFFILVIAMMCAPTVLAQIYDLEKGNTVSVSVNGDKNGIVQNAFIEAFFSAGLKIANNNADYKLDVHIVLTPLDITNNLFTYFRIELVANLLDKDGNIALPYSFIDREGHHNPSLVEDRSFSYMVRKINAEYGNFLINNISRK